MIHVKCSQPNRSTVARQRIELSYEILRLSGKLAWYSISLLCIYSGTAHLDSCHSFSRNACLLRKPNESCLKLWDFSIALWITDNQMNKKQLTKIFLTFGKLFATLNQMALLPWKRSAGEKIKFANNLKAGVLQRSAFDFVYVQKLKLENQKSNN